MKPFNLQEALAGKPVVTRDGRPVKIAGYNDKVQDETQICGWYLDSGQVWGWYKDGLNRQYKQSDSDLFMAPTERKEWIVRSKKGKVICGPMSYEEAQNHGLVNEGGTIHEITIIE